MKKLTLLTTSAVMLFGALSVTANAESNGTITFNGMVTDSTCDVSVNGQGADATVNLPTVSSSLLTSEGQTTGRTQFNMELTNCTLGTSAGDSVSEVSAFFQSGSTVDPATGHLKQQDASGAQNVSLQLLDGTTMQPIKAGDSSQLTDNSYYKLTDTGDATGNPLPTIEIPYDVEYYADGPVTPGVVASSVIYNLMYK